MAVKRGEVPPKPKVDTRKEQSRQRLEKITERVEKMLSDGNALEKADAMKLATTLKACHSQLRALREDTEGVQTVRTHAEARAKVEEELASLCSALRRLPPGVQRHFREMLDKHLPGLS